MRSRRDPLQALGDLVLWSVVGLVSMFRQDLDSSRQAWLQMVRLAARMRTVVAHNCFDGIHPSWAGTLAAVGVLASLT